MRISLIFILISISSTSPYNPLKKLKEKAQNAYKKKFGRDKTWHFLGHDQSEYPGINEQYRQLNRDKWEEYYKCLRTSETNEFSAIPEAVQAFEGASVTLVCKLCISPKETQQIDAVEWDWAPPFNKTLQGVELTEHILISPEDRELRIYDVEQRHTGQYVCSIGETQSPPYLLTVIAAKDDDLSEVHSDEAPIEPHPKKPERIPGTDLVLDTEWGPWTPCSKCNEIGRRHRLGYCIVFHETHVDSTKTITNIYFNNQTNTTTKISQEDNELLRIFQFGIPCESYVLPFDIRKMQQVKDRKDEVMTGFCKVDCPKDRIFEVRDKNGNVIERANNSAGIYSMLQGPPPDQPSVERNLLYAVKGKSIVLSCPGNLNSDVPIQWQIGSKNLIPELLSKETKGRIYISITDKIHIKEAKIADSNIYSCWQNKQLAGTVRLIVEKKISLNFNQHIMLIGVVAIFSTFLLVFIRAFFGRKAAKRGVK